MGRMDEEQAVNCIWTVNFKRLQDVNFHNTEGALSGLRQFLATESPLRMMKNDVKTIFFHLKSSSRFQDI